MLNAKSVQTYFPTDSSLSLQFGANLFDLTEYRAVVGSLQYLLLTHLDTAFTINNLSRFIHNPTTEHWVLVKSLFKYLCGTLNLGFKLYRVFIFTCILVRELTWFLIYWCLHCIYRAQSYFLGNFALLLMLQLKLFVCASC